jgi:hypothetical protein
MNEIATKRNKLFFTSLRTTAATTPCQDHHLISPPPFLFLFYFILNFLFFLALRPVSAAAPHQPRLDWQAWFAALGTYQHNPWLVNLVYHILNGTPEVTAFSSYFFF